MNEVTNEREAVRLANVSKVFGTNSHLTTAVRDVTLSAFAGELVLLLGPSGSGKTTLLTLMAGLIEPTEGRVLLFGSDVQRYSEDELQELRARRLGFIFQNFLLVDSLSVLENISLVLQFAGKGKAAARSAARGLLRQFALERFANAFPLRLSQGERQRVAIARAIANGANLITADEPTASLESGQGLVIIELLRSLAHEGNRGVIVASHDLRLVKFADRVVRLRDGAIERVDCGERLQPNSVESRWPTRGESQEKIQADRGKWVVSHD
jgi:putative ABC transport system ATP-binding protein